MEEYSRACRKAGAIPPSDEKISRWGQILLGHSRLPRRDTGKVPRLGVPKRTSLLVHQWNHMLWRGSWQLGEQDENMPKVRGLSFYVNVIEIYLKITIFPSMWSYHVLSK